jgi:hypothetical protein
MHAWTTLAHQSASVTASFPSDVLLAPTRRPHENLDWFQETEPGDAGRRPQAALRERQPRYSRHPPLVRPAPPQSPPHLAQTHARSVEGSPRLRALLPKQPEHEMLRTYRTTSERIGFLDSPDWAVAPSPLQLNPSSPESRTPTLRWRARR